MISNRSLFVILPLFLTLVTIVSAAPVVNINSVMQVLLDETNENVTTVEPVAYDDDKNESAETSNEVDDDELVLTTTTYQQGTTAVPEVVTNGLLFVNDTEASVDINDLIELSNALLFKDQVELSATTPSSPPTTTENLLSDQLHAPVADEQV